MLYADRCRETTLSSGTGAIALLGAGTGYQSFNTAFGTGTTFPYCIAGQTSAEWEVGTGTLSAASTLVRSSVLASSNGGSLVNFSAGTKDVFCTLPAGLIVDPSTSQTLSNKSFATPVSITEAVGVSALTLVGATQTVSTPVLNASQTWNNAGTTFTGLKLNITDTASNAASLLADLQVGGTSKMSLDKAGNLTIAGSPTIQQTGYLHWTGRTYLLANADGNLTVTNNAQTSQLKLLIAGNGQWQFGAADAASPVAQTFGVQSVVAGTTDTAGANFTINGSQGTGTGAGGSIVFRTSAAGGSTGSAQNALTAALTLAADKSATFTGNITTTGSIQGFTITATNAFAVGNTNVLLVQDAADILAQRRSVNAQTFRLYNTFTDASNFERAMFQWNSNVLMIGTEKLGTGVGRELRLYTDGIQRVAVAATGSVTINAPTSGDAFKATGAPANWTASFVSTTTTGQGSFGIQAYGSTDGTMLSQFFNQNASGSTQVTVNAANGAVGSTWIVSTALVSIGSTTAHTLRLLTNGAARLTIDSAGAAILNAPTTGVAFTVSPLAGQNAIVATGAVKLGSFTVAGLPSAATVGAGSRAFVTDALTPTFMATVAAGGAVFTPVYSDGTNWKVG